MLQERNLPLDEQQILAHQQSTCKQPVNSRILTPKPIQPKPENLLFSHAAPGPPPGHGTMSQSLPAPQLRATLLNTQPYKSELLQQSYGGLNQYEAQQQQQQPVAAGGMLSLLNSTELTPQQHQQFPHPVLTDHHSHHPHLASPLSLPDTKPIFSTSRQQQQPHSVGFIAPDVGHRYQMIDEVPVFCNTSSATDSRNNTYNDLCEDLDSTSGPLVQPPQISSYLALNSSSSISSTAPQPQPGFALSVNDNERAGGGAVRGQGQTSVQDIVTLLPNINSIEINSSSENSLSPPAAGAGSLPPSTARHTAAAAAAAAVGAALVAAPFCHSALLQRLLPTPPLSPEQLPLPQTVDPLQAEMDRNINEFTGDVAAAGPRLSAVLVEQFLNSLESGARKSVEIAALDRGVGLDEYVRQMARKSLQMGDTESCRSSAERDSSLNSFLPDLPALRSALEANTAAAETMNREIPPMEPVSLSAPAVPFSEQPLIAMPNGETAAGAAAAGIECVMKAESNIDNNLSTSGNLSRGRRRKPNLRRPAANLVQRGEKTVSGKTTTDMVVLGATTNNTAAGMEDRSNADSATTSIGVLAVIPPPPKYLRRRSSSLTDSIFRGLGLLPSSSNRRISSIHQPQQQAVVCDDIEMGLEEAVSGDRDMSIAGYPSWPSQRASRSFSDLETISSVDWFNSINTVTTNPTSHDHHQQPNSMMIHQQKIPQYNWEQKMPPLFHSNAASSLANSQAHQGPHSSMMSHDQNLIHHNITNTNIPHTSNWNGLTHLNTVSSLTNSTSNPHQSDQNIVHHQVAVGHGAAGWSPSDPLLEQQQNQRQQQEQLSHQQILQQHQNLSFSNPFRR